MTKESVLGWTLLLVSLILIEETKPKGLQLQQESFR